MGDRPWRKCEGNDEDGFDPDGCLRSMLMTWTPQVLKAFSESVLSLQPINIKC